MIDTVSRGTVAARPTLVVAAHTTWPEFPGLWRPLLDEVWAFLRAAGITHGCPNVMLYLDDDPHVKARQMVVEVDHPVIGPMKTLGVPVKLSETPGAVTRAAPTLGQHTVQVLAEIGYSEQEIDALREAGVIYSTGDIDGTYVAPEQAIVHS